MNVNLMRIVLILLLVAALTGIGWWERQRRTRSGRHEREAFEGIGIEIRAGGENESFLDFSGLDGITATSDFAPDTSPRIVLEGSSPQSSTRSSRRTPPVEEKLIVINLMAPVDCPYSGPDLLTAIQGANIVYGDMNIFHHRVKGQRRPIFSMANMVEPGTFNPPSMDDFLTPGLTFFMRLPGQVRGPQALDQMLKSVQHLATDLGGNLCDQRRRPLDKRAIAKLRDDVAKYQQRLEGTT
ncbi:cell division protein ZipA [Gammaproteobacteria bacterium]